MGASHFFCTQPVFRKAPSIPRVSGAAASGYNTRKQVKSRPERFLTYPWDAGGISIPKKTSKIYRTSIENLSNIYRKSIEYLSKSIENLSNIYRKSIEHLSNIYRTSIEHLSKICRTSIEHLPKICRTSVGLGWIWGVSG